MSTSWPGFPGARFPPGQVSPWGRPGDQCRGWGPGATVPSMGCLHLCDASQGRDPLYMSPTDHPPKNTPPSPPIYLGLNLDGAQQTPKSVPGPDFDDYHTFPTSILIVFDEFRRCRRFSAVFADFDGFHSFQQFLQVFAVFDGFRRLSRIILQISSKN